MTMLTFGMLWDMKDNTHKQAILDAAQYYQKKYGQKPTHCTINNKADAPESVNGIKIQRAKSIRPNHVFIGIIEKSK